MKYMSFKLKFMNTKGIVISALCLGTFFSGYMNAQDSALDAWPEETLGLFEAAATESAQRNKFLRGKISEDLGLSIKQAVDFEAIVDAYRVKADRIILNYSAVEKIDNNAFQIRIEKHEDEGAELKRALQEDLLQLVGADTYQVFADKYLKRLRSQFFSFGESSRIVSFDIKDSKFGEITEIKDAYIDFGRWSGSRQPFPPTGRYQSLGVLLEAKR